MSEAVATSATELIGGNPPQKKQRPPWPPGAPLVESFPGSGMYRHPVDKAYIKPADAIALGAPAPTPSAKPTPQPAPAPEPAKPEPAPQPAPEPQPTPKPEPAGPAPDFSDLPKGDGPGSPGEQAKEPSESEILMAYERLAVMFWDSIIRLLAALLGEFLLPKTPDERKMVIDAIVLWLKATAFAAITPIQNLWFAIGFYALPRMPASIQKITHWWKTRKQKRGKGPEPEQPKKENGQPHNFAGVNVDQEPISVESEILRGPGV
jgi:hypothetical protein